MDTITILGISLLFFYSLTTILQFYGFDTSVYAIYILFYVFLIISRLILPTTYVKLFPDSESDVIGSASNSNSEFISSGTIAGIEKEPTSTFAPTPA